VSVAVLLTELVKLASCVAVVAAQAALFPLTAEDQAALGEKETARTLKLRSVLARRLVSRKGG
jgi:hypothetical protein